MRKTPSNTQPSSKSNSRRNSNNENERRSNKSESGYVSTKSQEFHSQHTVAPSINQNEQPAVRASTSTDDCDDHTTIKCVLVGDGAVGKTSLIVSYTTNGYPHEYVPTAYDTYTVKVHVNNEPIRLVLADTAGQTDFDSVRPLCYADADVFLLCFSVVSPNSFYHLADQWMPEIKKHAPNTPIILCGTQIDLRTNVQLRIELRDYGETVVSEQDGKEYANEINAAAYVECSALTQHRLKEVFDTCIMTGLASAHARTKSKDDSLINRPTSTLNRLFKTRLNRTPSVKGKTRIKVSTSDGKEVKLRESTPTTKTEPSVETNNNSEVMLKRRNSNTLIHDVRSKSKDDLHNASIVDSTTGKKKSPKVKKGWHRLLCIARRNV